MFFLGFLYLVVLVFIGENYSRKIRFILASIPLFGIALIRFGLGADYFSYEYIYRYISTHSFTEMLSYSENVQALFKILMFGFTRLKIPFHIFIALVSSFIIYINLKWIENNSPKFELSVLLQYSILYIYWSLSALRQGIVLTVMTYIFFNGKKEYKLVDKVITTIVLSLIHPSALIVPALYLVSRVKWNKVSLALLMLASPLFKYIIGDQLIAIVSSMPVLNKISRYVSYGEISFFSTPSLMRISFILVILFHYDKLIKKFSDKKIMIDFSLLGLIGYFYLPVAMVVGTRTTIFSYALVIVILPMIVSLYKETKLYMVGVMSIILMSVVSFGNELYKLKDRTGFIGPVYELNFETIFNGSRSHFEDNPNLFYFEVLDSQFSNIEKSPIKSRVKKAYETPESFYNNTNYYTSVKFANGLYGVIDNEGNVVVIPKYKNKVEIFSNFMKINIFEGFGIHKNYKKIPASKEEVESSEKTLFLYEDISEIVNSDLSKKEKYSLSSYKVNGLKTERLKEYSFLSDFDLSSIEVATEFTLDVEPHVSYVRLLTKSREYYLILLNGKPLVENIYSKVEPYDSDGFAIGYTEYSKEYINKEGKVVWFENLTK